MKIVFLFLTGCIWAQTGLTRPGLGTMIDPAGRARPLWGTAGSLTLGAPGVAGVISSACSAGFCIFKKRSTIVSWTTQVNAPKGPALFALDESRAFVYFPESHQLALWHDSQLDFQNLPDLGEIVSMRMGSHGLEFAVRAGGGISIVNADGAVLDSIPSASGAVMLLSGGVLYATPGELVLRRPDASEMRWPVAGAVNFSAMSDGYVEFRAGRSIYGLCIDPGHEQIFELPVP
ncbi:MAG: hypothetical protein ACRD30_06805, partial [Bryobacteraceae bacterium]